MIKKVCILIALIIIVILTIPFLNKSPSPNPKPTPSASEPVEIEKINPAVKEIKTTATSSEDYAYRYDRLNLLQKIKGFKKENVRVVMNENETLILLANDTQVYLLHLPGYEGKFITNVTNPSKLYSLSYYSQTDNIFTDGINLYKFAEEDLVLLPINSPRVFRHSLYVKGIDKVYYGNQLIDKADPATFQFAASKPPRSAEDDSIPRMFYAKDLNYAYYKEKIIPGANVGSFDVYATRFREEYAHDTERVYFNGELIDGADFHSFFILSDQPYEGCRLGMYAKDKNFVFYKTEKVIGADPATFKALLNGYGKDVNHSYFEGKIIDNNPDKLEVRCDYG